jgi:hypothetical protein
MFRTREARIRLLLLPLLAFSLIVTGTSCGSSQTRETINYSRSFRAAEETQGHLRPADPGVRVNITGTDKVAVLNPAGGYYLIFESDLVGFVRAARRLALSDARGALVTEAELAEMDKKK